MKVWKAMALLTLTGVGVLILLTSGCVSKRVYRRDVLAHYKKGLKVGRVIGRDEILFKLKSPDCFIQPVDELMMPQADERFADPLERKQ